MPNKNLVSIVTLILPYDKSTDLLISRITPPGGLGLGFGCLMPLSTIFLQKMKTDKKIIITDPR
jgi:hypothetical protein